MSRRPVTRDAPARPRAPDERDLEIARLRRQLKDAHTIVAAIVFDAGGELRLSEHSIMRVCRGHVLSREQDLGAYIFRVEAREPTAV